MSKWGLVNLSPAIFCGSGVADVARVRHNAKRPPEGRPAAGDRAIHHPRLCLWHKGSTGANHSRLRIVKAEGAGADKDESTPIRLCGSGSIRLLAHARRIEWRYDPPRAGRTALCAEISLAVQNRPIKWSIQTLSGVRSKPKGAEPEEGRSVKKLAKLSWRARGGGGTCIAEVDHPIRGYRINPKGRPNSLALSGPDGLTPTVSWISFDGTAYWVRLSASQGWPRSIRVTQGDVDGAKE